MGEFFKGWRRKAGLVTLAMAMVLTAAWMRSRVVEDIVSFTWSDRLHMIVSSYSRASWWAMAKSRGAINWTSRSIPLTERGGNSHLEPLLWIELLTGGTKHGPAQTAIWTVNYWSLALPPTLLSAWLILIKPRKVERSP